MKLRPASACTTFAGPICRPFVTTVARPQQPPCCRMLRGLRLGRRLGLPMSVPQRSAPRRARAGAVSLSPCSPAPGGGRVERIVEPSDSGIGPPRRRAAPAVILNMVSTVDGRATLGALRRDQRAADRALFHALRPPSTRSGRRRHRPQRALRADHPDAAGASRGASAASPRSRWRASSPGASRWTGNPAARRARRAGRDPDRLGRQPARRAAPRSSMSRRGEGELDLAAALEGAARALRRAELLCEGGPHLARSCSPPGSVDELFLSLSPARGRRAGRAARRCASSPGAGSSPPRARAARRVRAASPACSCATACVGGRERVSRETTPSSSLAS